MDALLTAGHSEGALLPVQGVQLEVHGAGQRQGDPAEKGGDAYVVVDDGAHVDDGVHVFVTPC